MSKNTQEKTKKSIKVLHKAILPKKLNLQQERFCQLYVNNSETFSNATLAYGEAYQYNLEELSRINDVDDNNKEIKDSSPFARAYQVCATMGSKLLRKAEINDRINELFAQSLTDVTLDAELMRVIRQNYKLDAKVSAIKEGNKLKQRIVEKLDHTSNGQPITITISEAVAKKNGL